MQTILSDVNRLIPGNLFLEDPTRPANRAVPGIVTRRVGGYLPFDIQRNIRWTFDTNTQKWVAGPNYLTEEEGWHHVPSARVMKRRARRVERRKERRGWLGSFVEPAEAMPAL